MKITGANFAFINEKGELSGEAILHMKRRAPNPDGSIGYMAEPGTREWLAWEGYFAQLEADDDGFLRPRFPKQLAHMQTRASQRMAYMVPDQLPWNFDPSFTPDKVKPKPYQKQSKDMTPQERTAMVTRVNAKMRDPEVRRQDAKRNWVSAMDRLARDMDAYRSICKSRPDLVEKATEAEQHRHGFGWGAIAAEVEKLYWDSQSREVAA